MTDEETTGEIESKPGGSSVMDLLRHRRQLRAQEITHDIDIPGYGGDLFARYHLIDGKQLNAIASRIQKTERDPAGRNLLASVDVMVAACDGLYARDRGVERGLHEILGEETPVRYDVRLAQFLGFEGELGDAPTARGVVLALFNGNDLAVMSHSSRLQRWTMGAENELDEEFLGEL